MAHNNFWWRFLSRALIYALVGRRALTVALNPQGLARMWAQAKSGPPLHSSSLDPASFDQPAGVRASVKNNTECQIRLLAYEYGTTQLLPERSPFLELFDALELHTMCGLDRPPPSSVSSNKAPASLCAERFYVDALHGDDGNVGGAEDPFRTVYRAIQASRSVKKSASRECNIHMGDSPRVAVILRPGVYYLKKTINLVAGLDDGLLLTGDGSGEAWISGGVPLRDLKWQPYNITPQRQNLTCLQKCAAASHGCCTGVTSSFNQPSCAMGCEFAAELQQLSSGRTKCPDVCSAAAAADCNFVWRGRTFAMCESCSNNNCAPPSKTQCIEGCNFAAGAIAPCTGADGCVNIWKADLSHIDGLEVDTFHGLMSYGFATTGGLSTNGERRLPRARYPNAANVEDRFTVKNTENGILSYVAPNERGRPHPSADNVFVNLSVAVPPHQPYVYNGSLLWQYNAYTDGYCSGGVGDALCPAGPWRDYWISEVLSAGGGAVYAKQWESYSYHAGKNLAGGWENEDQGNGYYNGPVLPLGVRLDPTSDLGTRARAWERPERGPAYVVAWRAQGWFVNTYALSRVEVNESAILLNWTDNRTGMARGGSQGGRGWQLNGTTGSIDPSPPLYVENVFEELDAPGEWFYHAEENTLYLFHNASGAPPSGNNTAVLVATRLVELITITGTKTNPSVGITIANLGFRDAAASFFHTPKTVWGVPSGGDWALYRGAALLIEGAERTLVQNTTFRRVDGNAVLLSGYTRNVTLDRNEFAWIGDTAMAAWGRTPFGRNSFDATGGEQPRGTRVTRNWAHEVGIQQLQSSMWFQAKSAQTYLGSNVFINGPRSGINFNDNMGGGNVIENNLVANQCRQSGDHGPINSWERQPFLTNVSGTLGFVPAYTTVRNNFIIANYGGSQGFDNDDGSSWYNITNNFIYGEGLKQDYGGHDSKYEYNVNIVHHYDGQNCLNAWAFLPGHAHNYSHNVCVMLFDDKYASVSACNNNDLAGSICENKLQPNEQCMCHLQDNMYYTPFGNASMKCDGGNVGLNELQAAGVELGSSVTTLPTNEQIIQWGREKLLF